MTSNTSGATPRNDNPEWGRARQSSPITAGIQPHGFLVCLDENSHVVRASENIECLARRPLEQVLGAPLADLIGAEAANRIAEAIGADGPDGPDGTPLYVGVIADPRDGGAAGEAPLLPLPPLAAVAHRHAGTLIVELEPMLAPADVFASIYPLVCTFVASLRNVDAVEELATLAVREVRRITGFGRTLVCRFDGDGHGHVVAEDRARGYAPYFNQRFPASHISRQARERYLRNPIRLVADADRQFVRLVPPSRPTNDAPTELAYASLRGISPAQRDYMKNMGWRASLSIALVVHGRLWGLICCHHATPHLPPFEIRTACAHLGQILSLQIEAKEVHAETAYRLERAEEMAQLAFDLGRANKELEAFSYSVSHDLRAPLRHIVGYGDLLREYEAANLSERGNRFLKNIVDSARFAGTLVDDLLTFSQLGRAALRPAQVDMRELVDTAIHDQRADTQGRDIVWKVGELPMVAGDAAFLQLAVHNLLSNAIKYTRTREHAVIEIGSYPGAGEFALQQVFFVRDNGVGFNMKYVAKLFGVFQRLHRFEEFEGTGIGLANVRRIVERHDGRTWAEGKQDAGATFYFSLPQASQLPQAPQDAKRQRDSMAVGMPAQFASELPAARPGGWSGE